MRLIKLSSLLLTVMFLGACIILEEGSDYLIVRSAGDIRSDGQSGGLLFGVHYFHKNQLHTYKVTAEGNK